MRIFRHFSSLGLLALTAFLFLFSACRKVDVDFGSDYLDNGHTQVIRCDTITPVFSTVFVDSFPTSSTGVALIGAYTDPFMGKIAAQSYYELTIPAADAPVNEALFDSIVVMVTPNKTFYGDTSKPLSLSVYKLAQTIVPNTLTGAMYNINTVPLLPTALGQKTLIVRPGRGDSIPIRLSDALGQDLFRKLQTKDPLVTNSENFINYFKGLSIVADANSSIIVGCSDAITMRIYYHIPNITINNKTIDFTLSNSSHQFNHITIDRTGTALGNAGFGTTNAKKELSSSLTDKKAFVQYATGSMAKLTFPTIRTILQIPNYIKLMQANLIIKPVSNSFQYPYTLPPTLRLSMTDLNNQLGSDLSAQMGNSIVSQTGNLNIDSKNPVNTSYSFDVTSYINQSLLSSAGASAAVNGTGLLLARPANAHITSFDRLIVEADRTQTNTNTQLVIYYLTVK